MKAGAGAGLSEEDILRLGTPMERYIAAFYFGLNTLTSIGAGPPRPRR